MDVPKKRQKKRLLFRIGWSGQVNATMEFFFLKVIIGAFASCWLHQAPLLEMLIRAYHVSGGVLWAFMQKSCHLQIRILFLLFLSVFLSFPFSCCCTRATTITTLQEKGVGRNLVSPQMLGEMLSVFLCLASCTQPLLHWNMSLLVPILFRAFILTSCLTLSNASSASI